MYLIRGIENESYSDFKTRILSLSENFAEEIRPLAVRLTITLEPPPAISIIPFRKSKIAIISVYRADSGAVTSLLTAAGFSGGFEVTEAIPVGYEHPWAKGEVVPGACLLTLFHRKPKIDYDTFLDRWHNSHTPLSLKIHPLWNYNRNVVNSKLSDHPAWYDGIVEETTRTRAELLNPFKFFGRPHRILRNMLSVYTDTKSFLDYRKIETYLVAEFQVV